MSRTAIVVDASCDLPRSFYDEHQVKLVPISIRQDHELIHDTRDTKSTLDFYRTKQTTSLAMANSEVQSDQILYLFRNDLVPHYDSALIITTDENRSNLNHLIRETAFNNKELFPSIRQASGLESKFKIKIMDSTNIYTGQGLLAFETVRLITEKALSFDQLHKPLELLKTKIETYIVINDIESFRNSGDSKTMNQDGKKISWLNMKVGKMLDSKPLVKCVQGKYETISKEKGIHSAYKKLYSLIEQIPANGFARPVVNISYAGNLAELKTDPAFVEFANKIKRKNIKTLMSMMSISAAVSVGKGALSISYVKK